jgi:hypothetical protein
MTQSGDCLVIALSAWGLRFRFAVLSTSVTIPLSRQETAVRAVDTTTAPELAAEQVRRILVQSLEAESRFRAGANLGVVVCARGGV